MEGDVVFPDELEEFHLIGVLPPGFPVKSLFFGERNGHGDITNWGVKPDIEHFIFISSQGNRNPPLEITSNRARPQPVAQPCLCHLNGVIRPKTFLTSFLDPWLQFW